VLGSDFRVHGTSRLRVADASVFPRIPGYFIACAIYMIAEKAADMILADAMDYTDPLSGSALPSRRTASCGCLSSDDEQKQEPPPGGAHN
jgi:choline dehydrogenase-like flavoprotein